MAKRLTSIFTEDMDTCFFTGTNYWVQRHHIFSATTNMRKLSEEYGLILPVTQPLHTNTKYGIHCNAALRRAIKQFAQRRFEKEHTREEFVLLFGRNYLMDESDGYEINIHDYGVPVFGEAC